MKNIIFPKTVPATGRVRICLELLKEQGVKGKVLVDVGSSFGWLEKAISGWGAIKIIGIEPDEKVLLFAKKNAPQAEFLQGRADNIPLADSSADIVIFYDVIEHLRKRGELKALCEVKRVLKKDGVLLFSTPNASLLSNICDIAWYFGHRHYTEKQVSKFMDKAGFRVKKIMKKGSLLSSLYLSWFYIAKRILGTSQPRNKFFEKIDDEGYKKEGITDIFLVAIKK